ncbi:hypothetical protein PIB30_038451 [Stylosanthes scabra]|uniref:Uncharacterized protein n=1 Tax=Stylosanthes scabra TaxID=79078 RepID=A0ABU6XEE3_9FABA|nr:hypothetical protein [Stylosanthes scabra]
MNSSDQYHDALDYTLLGRSVVDDSQQPINTPLDPEPLASSEQPPLDIIYISSDSDSEPKEEDSRDLSRNEISVEEEPEEEADVPLSRKWSMCHIQNMTSPSNLCLHILCFLIHFICIHMELMVLFISSLI